MHARMLAIAVLFAGFAFTARAADPIDYKPYASSDGRYKIVFPGPVKTETTDVKAPSGPLKLTLDSVEVSDGVFFMVTYIDAPDDVAKQPASPRLDKVRDGNKGDEGKVHADKAIEVGLEKLPGRDLLIEKPSLFIRNRVVIAGNRLYQVMVQGTKEFVTSKEVDRFYEAFEVTK
jgi:hypothetical protein